MRPRADENKLEDGGLRAFERDERTLCDGCTGLAITQLNDAVASGRGDDSVVALEGCRSQCGSLDALEPRSACSASLPALQLVGN
jgi:hypothetical protein